jgi:hypothetical protein
MVTQQLVTFLKKFSTIPNTFIDDMFAMYNPDTIQTDMAINLDAVAKWLGVRKDNLMATLKASYASGIDYEVSRKTNPSIKGKFGGNSYKLVLLTPDCFKRLCMRSKGKTAEDVRSYFINVESLVMKYRQQMMDGMQHDIERLESGRLARGLPRSPPAPEGYIYVLRASAKYDSVVKIGRTRDLVRRLREHSAALADDPQVLFTFRTDDAVAVETCVKGWLKDRQWVRGRYKEVFKADLDMVKQLVHGCDLAGKVKRVTKGIHQRGGDNTPGMFIMIGR